MSKMYLIIVSFIFSLISLYAQDNCKTSFQSFGLTEFDPFVDKVDLKKNLKVDKEVHGKYEYYSLEKKEVIIGKESVVIYSFAFNNDNLISCSFKVKCKKVLFIKLRDCIIKSNKSSFINLSGKSKYRFEEVNKKCKKYFSTKYSGKKFYIFGGVDFE